MGLVKTRRLAAMQKQQKYPPNEVSRVAVAMRGAKAGMKPPVPKVSRANFKRPVESRRKQPTN